MKEMYVEKFLQQVNRTLNENGISNTKLRDDCIEVFERNNVIFKIYGNGGMFYSSDKQYRNVVDKLHEKIQPFMPNKKDYMGNGQLLLRKQAKYNIK